MYIESDQSFDTMPVLPIIIRVHQITSMSEATLDTEVIERQTDGTVRIKTYDASGAVVILVVPQSIAEEIVFGDIGYAK